MGVQGPNSWEPIWTHLKQIWVLGLNLALDPSLHLGSPNHELFILVWTNWFSSKMVPCRFRLNLSLFGLGPWSKGCGSNLWLLANRIALFHWTLDLGPSSKVTLNYPEKLTDNFLCTILLLQHFVLRIHPPRVQNLVSTTLKATSSFTVILFCAGLPALSLVGCPQEFGGFRGLQVVTVISNFVDTLGAWRSLKT